jgi:hypothetical protein
MESLRSIVSNFNIHLKGANIDRRNHGAGGPGHREYL